MDGGVDDFFYLCLSCMKRLKIIVAPDSYKECLSAIEVSAAMAEGVLLKYPEASVIQLPLADGGEGTLEILSSAMGVTIRRVMVSDPLGRTVEADFGVVGSTGIVEVARSCGLPLLSKDERNPMTALSTGVGELVLSAEKAGCRHLIVGLGGSATCDGGVGMLSVPGVKDALGRMDVELLCDVGNPFIGQNGAARVFAPRTCRRP